MRLVARLIPALLFSLPAVLVASASAAKLTLGSDLSADATITESHGADTAFWPIVVGDQPFAVPEDGQVLSVKVKGTVLKEKGAADPATLVHVQSLEPAAADGSRAVYLSSQGFDMPIDQPNAISTFTPENLCVHRGGSVSFNEIGGFMYGGSLSAPPDQRHYLGGAPYQMFGAVPTSSTARYTADNATKNGDTLYPNTANQQPGRPAGTVNQGSELLMQVVIGTADDRSEPCGGPRRHPDGTLVDTTKPPAMHIIGGQSPYVRGNGKLEPAIYCAGPSNCTGTVSLVRKGKVVTRASFSVPAAKSGRINMRLKPKDNAALRKTKNRKLPVTMDLVSPLGMFSKVLVLQN